MIANLHTHTTRCGHAFGAEREFIETAISQGFQTLGFSDHAPMLFPDGFYSHKIRMRPEELEDYVSTLQNLRQEYQNSIEILIGLEVEYYPALFDRTFEFYRQYPLDYLILGQHYIENEYDFPGHVILGMSEPDMLKRYVDQCICGMETGCFTFVAHPDAFLFTGEGDVYNREMRRLCLCAKERDIPLEINMYGIIKGGHYPNDRFWDIAAEVGNSVVISCDAHKPEVLANKTVRESAYALAERHGFTPLTMPKLVRPF